jgi:hypothetical protein
MENGFILQKQPATFEVFVEHWAKHFNAYKPTEWLAEGLMFGKGLLSPSDIKSLFSGKEETESFSLFTLKSVSDVVKGYEVVRKLQKQFDEELFQREFGHLSVVGQIVLLQTIQPGKFPLFDAHIFRGYMYMKLQQIQELEDLSKTEQFNAYLEYKTFAFAKLNDKMALRKIDKAFWAFGKFLENEWGRRITT